MSSVAVFVRGKVRILCSEYASYPVLFEWVDLGIMSKNSQKRCAILLTLKVSVQLFSHSERFDILSESTAPATVSASSGRAPDDDI